MMPQGEHTWADDLIPMIEPAAATDIISRVADLALVISDTGVVTRILSNPDFAGHKSAAGWENAPIQDSLNFESVSKFDYRFKQFIAGAGGDLPVELNHVTDDSRVELPMRYSFHNIGSDGSILMLGSDLRAVADMQQQLVAAQIALENDYEVQREHDIRFRVLMEASDIATLLISVRTGDIVACNTAAERLFSKTQDTLVGASFAREFETKEHGDVIDRLVAAASKQAVSAVSEILTNGKEHLLLTPTLFRGASSQMLLCKIALEGKPTRADDRLQTNLTELFQNGVDALVFVDGSGRILSSNEAFPKLAEMTHSRGAQGRPFAEFLARGAVDLNVMQENARRTGAMRLYATKIVSEHGFERPVEISTTLLSAGGEPIFGMVIREVRRSDAGSGGQKKIDDVDMASVKELIGGQSLKEIVAKTTDVVEKMCIETAVEMTSNNRVAAAEMLGLSRQSLYVKLRKYDLVNKS